MTGQAGGGQDLAYHYDAAGRHLHEQTVQAGITYQDQTLGYDALGRLRVVQDELEGVFVNTTYDAVGNKLHQHTDYTTLNPERILDYGDIVVGVDESGVEIHEWGVVGSHVLNHQVAHSQDLWFAYDAMNRQVLADGAVDSNVNNAANLIDTQGHVLGYDADGNRISDSFIGTQVLPEDALDESATSWASPTARAPGASPSGTAMTPWTA